ncbi:MULTISPECIES: SAM-dependent methyltransferase [unclassified Nocardiopsis]|uniref:SAM-dependent methyltransferase n=1 Tax=unclassified Nocardiopsis TaxID=2649073 RepID=UPI0019159125|nr:MULTISPECIES: SAM-dependent methyltransferase [unclassified Nocardiopsis]
MTKARGPEPGPLTAVFRGRDPVPVPGQRARVVSLRPRPQEPSDADRSAGVRLQQAFLGRVIDYLCADAGVRQFVDWGCPAPGTDQRVRAAAPDASVLHLAPHGTAGMLSASGAAVLSGDGSGSHALLRRLSTCGLVDFDEPVAVLMTTPFPADDPPSAVGGLHALMRGGGYLALAAPAPRTAVERAFAPFTPVDPGVADIAWWPYPDEDVSDRGSGTLGGLGRTPARGRGSRRWR